LINSSYTETTHLEEDFYISQPNKMKNRILSLLFASLFIVGISWATYTPTTKDIANLKDLKSQLDTLIVNNNINLWDFYNQTNNLSNQYSWDERLSYLIWELKTYLHTNLTNQKWAAKSTSKVAKKDFLAQYNTGFDPSIEYTVDQCIWRYNTIDDLSFAYDFPTALTLAIRYRESNCGYYLPKNWNWPFQITTKDYGTWDMTQQVFIQAVTDFLEFATNKWKKSSSWNLSYSNYDYTWIINFAALYNGGTKSWELITPNNPNYVFDGYGAEYTWAKRFGVLPQTLKILERELDNKY